MTDPATAIYQEYSYRGKRLISFGTLLIVTLWLTNDIIRQTIDPSLHSNISFLWFILGMVLYLIGYWRAVISKGYSRVLFLASLTGPIGLVIIMFMPPINAQQVDTGKADPISDKLGSSSRE